MNSLEREAYCKAWSAEMNRQSEIIRCTVEADLLKPDPVIVWALRIGATSTIIAVFAAIMAIIGAFQS